MAIEGGDGGVIQAAGGLVWRDTSQGKELAVIHRARYGDWTLPKGKLKSAEQWQEAALREVHEETGCPVRLEGFAGSVSYLVDQLPKVVLFWNMALIGECDFQPSEEVDALLWLSVPAALKKLSYAHERELIARYLQPRTRRVPLARLWRDWASPSAARLAGSLSVYRAELDYLVQQATGDASPRPTWASAAFTLLDSAAQALAEGDVDLGWHCFHAVQRLELFGMDRPALTTRAHGVLREAADKLSGWRRQAVTGLLSQDGQLKPDLQVADVFRASQILHEHYANVYRKLAILRQQLGILAVVGLLAAIAWIALGLPMTGPASSADSRLVPSAMLFGIMGASISGILSLARGAAGARIPDQLIFAWITLARLVVGAVAALVVYAFLASGLLQLGPLTPGLILAISFAAGFSERLVVSAVEAVAR